MDWYRYTLIQGKRGWLGAVLASQARDTSNPGAQQALSDEEILMMISRDPDATQRASDARRESLRAEARHKVAREAANLLIQASARFRDARESTDTERAARLRAEGDERLTDLRRIDKWAKDRPFVVLSPQHPGGGCPSPTEIHDFFTFALSHYDINPARVYLTGLSCGAIGSWAYLGDYLDEQIVALVPIAGDGKGAFNKAACELGRVAIWAFHGDADNIVGVTGTTEPVTKLQMCDPKPDVDMVLYPGVGHDSWSMTYDLSAGHDIYAWLLAHYKLP